MNRFLSLLNKDYRTIIGCLSGTSIDAVDVVLVKVAGSGINTKINVIDFHSYPINKELKKFILKCSAIESSNVEDLCRLNFVIAHLFSNAIKKLISRNNILTKDIDLIGSHGQTIYHYPFNKKLFSFSSRSTLQIGDPSVIANLTNITTVGDFRSADMSVNGQGAPLVPYLDFILFSHKTKSRIFVNIGGITNVTYLHKSCSQNEVVAFDCGPGNIMMDYLMKKFYNKSYDRSGKIAGQGKVNAELFKYICSRDKFYKVKPPKSTGREYYSAKFTDQILNKFKKLKPQDIIVTFTKYTAFTLFYNVREFKINELIISGGGAKNLTLMNFIKEYFTGVDVSIINEMGINPDNKEAVLFAVLANELLSGNKANMTSVSGSDKNVFLGKICLA